MSSVEPSSSVPIACSRNLTLSCARRRRWISAMYSLALGSGRPSAITVRSAVATAARASSEVGPDGLHLEVRVEVRVAHLAPDPGRLVAAERRGRIARAPHVHVHGSGLQ